MRGKVQQSQIKEKVLKEERKNEVKKYLSWTDGQNSETMNISNDKYDSKYERIFC